MAIHGALLDVHGVGVLLRGPSGVGKSECALELVSRGHCLVADDVVQLRCDHGVLLGSAPERIRHHLEIRGLGILFIPDLYGPDATRDEMRIDLVCRLDRWREGARYDRVGLERPVEDLAGVRIPTLTFPARPGGSMATIVEAAAREHLRRAVAGSAAARLDARLRDEMSRS